MIIGAMHEMASSFVSMAHWIDPLQALHWHLPLDLAAMKDIDLMADVQKAFNNFIKTGQVWAFLIGVVFGYLFKALTSYG